MNTSSKRRISPSLILSILALFVAIGGTSYAAVKINGKNIKAGTVAGKALKKNTLTGAQINESKLGVVPKAQSADSAGNANKANSATSAETATRADTAANADKVGGKTAAELASPAAYAYVDAGPSTISVPAEWSFGFESATVTRENSFTCIRGLGFQPRHAQVTPYRVPAGTTNDIPNVVLSDNNFCDGREEVAVQMVDGGTGAPNDTQRYYIALYK